MTALTEFAELFPLRDFHAFYLSASDYWNAGFLYLPHYNTNLNPPHVSVLLFSPLVLIRPELAATAWFLLTAVLIWISVAIIRSELQLPLNRLLWVVGVMLASSAMHQNLAQGQIGAVLMLLCTLAWRAARREAATAAWWLAVVISVKPPFGIWLLTQRLRNASRTMVIGGVGVVLGVLLIGSGNWFGWMLALEANSGGPWPSNFSIMGLLLRAISQRVGFAPVWPLPLVWAALCAPVLWVARQARHDNLDRSWLIWGLTGLLVSPVGWVYYLLIIAGPLISWGEQHRWPLATQIALGLFLVPVPVAHLIWDWYPLASSIYTLAAILLWGSTITAQETTTLSNLTSRTG